MLKVSAMYGLCVCGFWGECVERFRFGQLPLSSTSKSSSHLILTVTLKIAMTSPVLQMSKMTLSEPK